VKSNEKLPRQCCNQELNSSTRLKVQLCLREDAAQPATVDSEFTVADLPTTDDLARLESEVLRNQTSELARENLLAALSADPERFDDPRRFELIEWFLEHNPRNSVCTTPFMRASPETAPDAYGRLKARVCARGRWDTRRATIRRIVGCAAKDLLIR
jgi:hypothetical protein